jgi:molecular chaperone HtpG
MAEQTSGKPIRFKAEITQLLDILVHSLYKERDIFLRELVSNAADALTRMQFELLTNQDVLDADAELAIKIELVDEGEQNVLIVKDSGVGMTKDELIQNLGTIAQSGAREFIQRLEKDEGNPADIIGRFGVGFYSAFMVADEIRVISRSYRKRAKAATWVSQGGESFQIEEANKEDRGTEIHLRLKKDAQEFTDDYSLRQIVKKYSDYVGYPIYVAGDIANQQLPLWKKRPAEVEDEEYTQFYQQHTMDFEEPLATIHFASDAPLHVRSLLFIPANREKSVLNLRKEPGVELFSHNVLIQEYCQDLLPRWLDFIYGIVESEDLPLNVSRESIQNTRVMRQLAKSIRKRVLRELRKMATDGSEQYAKFWQQYERSLKEGLTSEPDAKDEMLPLFRFYSSRSEGELTTLDEYVANMPEDQEEIYYVMGEDKQTVAFSPHLDPFKARQIEVLYWVNPIDPFIAPILTEYNGKKFRNVDDAGVDISGDDSSAEDSEQENLIEEADFNLLIGRFVTTLGDRVLEVRQSSILKDSAVRLVSPADSPDRDMQRLYKYLDQEYQVPKKILEINRQHGLVANLAHLVNVDPDDEIINLTIEQLYENALVIEGLHPNPVSMMPRIQSILELAIESEIESRDSKNS